MTIKAVLFDVGGTLIHPHPSVGDIYSTVAKRHGVQLPADDLNERFRYNWKVRKAFREPITREWWLTLVTDVFSGDKFENFPKFFDELFAEFDKAAVWKVFPDVLPVLKELKKRKIKMGIASNWDSRLPNLLKKLKLNTHFDYEFISFKFDALKSNPFFFQSALKEMNLNADEVVHIGDDLQEDLKGAGQVGIKALLLDRKKSAPAKTDTIQTLQDLLSQNHL